MSFSKNTVIQFTQNGMGSGSEELSVILATNYLKILLQENNLPRFLIFYNGGVKLVCAGSPLVSILKEIEKKEVKIMVCTTCLKYYNLLDKKEVGIAGTMMDIVEIQSNSEKVLSL
jgi:selenium metabolism protein YedF